MKNTIRYMVSDMRGECVRPYIQEYDALVGIDILRGTKIFPAVGTKIFPAVGKYMVSYRCEGGDSGTWTAGGPGTYVDYKGIRYEGDGLERLRALLEKEKIEKLLEAMA